MKIFVQWYLFLYDSKCDLHEIVCKDYYKILFHFAPLQYTSYLELFSIKRKIGQPTTSVTNVCDEEVTKFTRRFKNCLQKIEKTADSVVDHSWQFISWPSYRKLSARWVSSSKQKHACAWCRETIVKLIITIENWGDIIFLVLVLVCNCRLRH